MVPARRKKRSSTEPLSFEDQIKVYILASAGMVMIRTAEVDRCIEHLQAIVEDLNENLDQLELAPESPIFTSGLQFYRWDSVKGLWRDGEKVQGTVETPAKALRHMCGTDALPGVYVLENFHLHLNSPRDLPDLIQWTRDAVQIGRENNRTIVLVGPFEKLPPEISTLAVPIDYAYPDREQIVDYITAYCEDYGLEFSKKEIREAAMAASGMTMHEVDSTLAVTLWSTDRRSLDPQRIFEEKAGAVRRSGLLEHIRTDLDLTNDVGGMDLFKARASEVAMAFQDRERAEKYKLPPLKGSLLVGVRGGGKSLLAKAIANHIRVPLFRLDVGRLFGGIVGETEQNVRDFQAQAEAMAPCAVWMDEIEKGMARETGVNDGGITERMLHSFLFWLQEKRAPVYMIATANEIFRLPDELTRRGRWDDVWWIDLPDAAARLEIFQIHLRRVGRDPKKFEPAKMKRLAAQATAFSGAEIENAVHQAMMTGFAAKREFTYADIEEAVKTIVPLGRIKAKEIEAMREEIGAWARPASSAAESPKVKKSGKVLYRKRPGA